MDVISKLDSLNPKEIPPLSDLKLPKKERKTSVFLVASIFAICISIAGYNTLERDRYSHREIVLVDNSYYSPNELWNSKTIITLEERKK